jgi:phosphate transport system permease protein
MTTPSYTGFERRRTSTRGVRIGDRVARVCIAIGGFGTIGAVLLVCGFLFWVVLPLFFPASLQEDGPRSSAVVPAGSADATLAQGMDPYRIALWRLRSDGVVELRSIHDGAVVVEQPLKETAEAILTVSGSHVLIAGAGQSARVASLGFEQRVMMQSGEAALESMHSDDVRALDGAVWQRTQEGFRRMSLEVDPGESFRVPTGSYAATDVLQREGGMLVAIADRSGNLLLRHLVRRENDFTGEIETETRTADCRLEELGLDRGVPARLTWISRGRNLLVLWSDGQCARLDTTDFAAPKVVERLDLLPADARQITATARLIGDRSVLVADGRGDVHSVFLIRTDDAAGARGTDGAELVVANLFASGGRGRVDQMATSSRTRTFAAVYDGGWLRVWHATSRRLLAETRLPRDVEVRSVTISPKEDAILVSYDRGHSLFQFRPGHPEVSLSALCLPVWYEGRPGPEHSWQSTGGSDEFEPKLGLWPLVFGTLKGTLYCILFGVPLALLAAIYTSEFLAPRYRNRIKPLVESMASLPSVILGYLAGQVFAPFVESWLTALLLCCLAIPLAWVLCSQVVQLFGQQARLRLERKRLWLAGISLPMGIGIAIGGAGLVDATLFAGSFQSWLQPDRAEQTSAFGGFFLLFLPAAALAAAWTLGRTGWLASRRAAGILRTAVGGGVAIGLAALASVLLSSLGLDLRGSVVDTYVQRNAVVVGFVMGFAVIPIIYTIAEDALSAVPEHLRAASLGAGATPWQTATRIVLPTAMSGIFSAIMVGLGRAVGETMIVLMAAGNTPVLELNPFSGFRTLSANLAVELPEAVRDSTHYRTLYLAALVLFAMTFLLNSGAELVRQRFRKRAWQL